MSFLDKVGENITKLSNDVSNKTKSVYEVTNLNTQIRACEEEIKKRYMEIGKLYCENNLNNPAPEYAEHVNKVKEAKEAIASINEQIVKAKGNKLCKSCGAEVPQSSQFCPSCGTKVEDENAGPKENKCPKCGKVNDESSAFCAGCGEKLS